MEKLNTIKVKDFPAFVIQERIKHRIAFLSANLTSSIEVDTISDETAQKAVLKLEGTKHIHTIKNDGKFRYMSPSSVSYVYINNIDEENVEYCSSIANCHYNGQDSVLTFYKNNCKETIKKSVKSLLNIQDQNVIKSKLIDIIDVMSGDVTKQIQKVYLQ